MSSLFIWLLMAALAVIFPHPSLVHKLVRVLVQHKRNKAACAALRAMRYSDIRRSR